MSKLGHYLKSLEKFGAQAVVLQSNQSVVLRFPTGDRHASQQTPHALVLQLLQRNGGIVLAKNKQHGHPARLQHRSSVRTLYHGCCVTNERSRRKVAYRFQMIADPFGMLFPRCRRIQVRRSGFQKFGGAVFLYKADAFLSGFLFFVGIGKGRGMKKSKTS